MTTVKEKSSIFDDKISHDNTGSKTTDFSESDETGIKDDIEVAENQDDNPTTTITININNHPSSVIIENAIGY